MQFNRFFYIFEKSLSMHIIKAITTAATKKERLVKNNGNFDAFLNNIRHIICNFLHFPLLLCSAFFILCFFYYYFFHYALHYSSSVLYFLILGSFFMLHAFLSCGWGYGGFYICLWADRVVTFQMNVDEVIFAYIQN